jgi:hypothetical protein
MARKSSRRRRKSSRRSTRRNPKYVVRNKKRRRRRSSRMRRNMFGGLGKVDWQKQVITPVLGGTAGFLTARYLGNLLAREDIISSDPKVGKALAVGVGIPATLMFAQRQKTGIIGKNAGFIVLGMGIAAAEAFLRDTPLLGGSPAASASMVTDSGVIAPEQADAPTTPESGDGLSSYYEYPVNEQGQALSDDYYTASMLGATADPADQQSVDSSLTRMEAQSNGGGIPAISTVIPTDQAMPMQMMPQFATVTERFANRGGRGYAGGVFARHLFSGMMGS